MDTDFILIDDDPISNMLSRMVIKKHFKEAEIVEFTNPEIGLEYILDHFGGKDVRRSILFLDINMPEMTGWELMERIEMADIDLDDRLLLYILSSSVSPDDQKKAEINQHVIDFLEKPLSPEVFERVKEKG